MREIKLQELKQSIREGMRRQTVHGTQEATEKTLREDSRGQGNLIGLMVGIGVAAIVGIGVAIPIVNDVISQSNTTGITSTVLGFIPVMLALLIFVASASPIMNRTR